MPSRSDFWDRLTLVSDVLAYSFDLHLVSGGPAPDWFDVEGERCVLCATDLSNGAYVECLKGENVSRALYVERGGEAFVLGPDFAHVVSLIVLLPWWREVLRGGANANLQRWRDVAQSLQQDFNADLPWLTEAQREVQREVALPELTDPVAFLHRWAVRPLQPVRVRLASGVTSYEPELERTPQRSVFWA